jgi:hypothetical protein
LVADAYNYDDFFSTTIMWRKFLRGSTSVAIRGGGSSSSAALDAFTADISDVIVQSKCVICHVSGGASGNTSLVFTRSGSDSDHLANNFEVFQNYLASEADGATQILDKVRGVAHGGGMQFSSFSSEYSNLSDFLNLLAD